MPSPMDPSPSFILSPEDTAILSDSYGDPLSLLRSSPFACHWIFTISEYVPPRPLTLSRAFRLLYMCAATNCAGPNPNLVLQKSSTLLLPVHSRDGLVAGFFVETGDTPRSGRYVYFPSTSQLLKASKMRATDMQSFHLTRISQVAASMYIIDNALASFAWSDVTAQIPAQHVIHSRVLTFCKLAHALPADDPKHNFFGLGDYGVFDCAVVTGEGYGIPTHATSCRRFQCAMVGAGADEVEALRAEFVRVFGSAESQDLTGVVATTAPTQLPAPPALVNSSPLPTNVLAPVSTAPIATGPIPPVMAGPPENLAPPSSLPAAVTNVPVSSAIPPRLPMSSTAAMIPPISSAQPIPPTATPLQPVAIPPPAGQISPPAGGIPPVPPPVPSPTATMSTAVSAGEDSKAGMSKFKKTLAAPTKSEIVIRNRISAQRSNEKRRRKIEATKKELAYLKSTYLPQLELRRGSLISENQTLRLRFMEKYQQSDFDSFF